MRRRGIIKVRAAEDVLRRSEDVRNKLVRLDVVERK